MPKNFIDWSDWKPGQGEPEHPLSKSLNSAKTGAEAVKEALTTGKLPSLGGEPPKQPTDKEMFGHLIPSEEQLRKAQEDWENRFKTLGFRGPVDGLNKSKVSDREWKTGKSFNSLLSEEEKKERNQYIGKD